MTPVPVAAAKTATPGSQPATKDLYEIGEIPPVGHVPRNMYGWAIRQERHGPPDTAMQIEVLPTWQIGEDECLVLVMAAGVNYNGVWASLGQPISPIDGHRNPYHVAGSDASGIVYAVGSKVRRWQVGDEVVIHCNQDDGDDEECNGGDPMFSTLAAHLGLRDAGRLVRPVLPRAGPATASPPPAPHLGGERLLHAHPRHGLPHAVRPPPPYPEARPERARVGRFRRPRIHGRPAHRHRRSQCDRRDLR